MLVRMQKIEQRTHLALFVVVPQILNEGLVADVGGVCLLSQLGLPTKRFLEANLLSLLETWLPFAISSTSEAAKGLSTRGKVACGTPCLLNLGLVNKQLKLVRIMLVYLLKQLMRLLRIDLVETL